MQSTGAAPSRDFAGTPVQPSGDAVIDCGGNQVLYAESLITVAQSHPDCVLILPPTSKNTLHATLIGTHPNRHFIMAFHTESMMNEKEENTPGMRQLTFVSMRNLYSLKGTMLVVAFRAVVQRARVPQRLSHLQGGQNVSVYEQELICLDFYHEGSIDYPHSSLILF